MKPAFNEVNAAKQEQEQTINIAEREYNKVIPEARGKAEKVVADAAGYAIDSENRAKGDASKFDDVVEAYKKAPDDHPPAALHRRHGRGLLQPGKPHHRRPRDEGHSCPCIRRRRRRSGAAASREWSRRNDALKSRTLRRSLVCPRASPW